MIGAYKESNGDIEYSRKLNNHLLEQNLADNLTKKKTNG